MGPIARDESRSDVIDRCLALLREGAARGCAVVAFPELCLTTFFPRWWTDGGSHLGSAAMAIEVEVTSQGHYDPPTPVPIDPTACLNRRYSAARSGKSFSITSRSRSEPSSAVPSA